MKGMFLNVNQFQKTKNDRNYYRHVVTALQRYQLKAVVSPFSNFICGDPYMIVLQAFAASSKACLFRMHYDIPGFLENIEPRFRWMDPAEVSCFKIFEILCALT